MSEPISVNEAIDRLTELDGQIVTLVGQLSLEFEGQRIGHVPTSERREPTLTFQDRSSIRVEFDMASLQQHEQWLDQFDERHVLVEGRLSSPISQFEGCGHMGWWPASFTVTAIKKYKARF